LFEELIAANKEYAEQFHDSGVAGRAAKHLAVVTCIDSRIDPLRMLGLEPGDAKIIRNAGARITDDALRSLILATNLLEVTRICVVQHTDCAMAGSTDEDLQARIGHLRGADASSVEFLAMPDQRTAVRGDVARIRECTLIPSDVEIGAFVFDVRTGELDPVQL